MKPLKKSQIIGLFVIVCCIVALVWAVMITNEFGSAGPAGKNNELINNPANEKPVVGNSQPPGEKPYPPETNVLSNPVSAYGENGDFSLTSDAGVGDGTLPAEYTCDGSGSSPALSWTNAPPGTREFALIMTTLPGDGTTKWNWVLYDIPALTSSLAKNTSGVGTPGVGSHGSTKGYQPPCSQGPGAKLYTFTLYALSGSPSLPDNGQMNGSVLTNAISSVTLGKASLNLSYTRPPF